MPQHSGQIFLGNRVRICRLVELSVPRGGRLKIGDGALLSRGVLLSVHGDTVIGNNVMVAEYSLLHDNDHQFADVALPIVSQGMIAGRIVIGDGSWIGANSIVLRGATVGSESIVGAGTVVKKMHEPGSIIVGVPGRTIRRRW